MSVNGHGMTCVLQRRPGTWSVTRVTAETVTQRLKRTTTTPAETLLRSTGYRAAGTDSGSSKHSNTMKNASRLVQGGFGVCCKTWITKKRCIGV